jgi:hypothetical protein
MINLIFRPFPGHIKPSKTMSLVELIVNFDNDMTIPRNGPSNVSWFESATASIYRPREKSGSSIVAEYLAEILWSKIRFNHDAHTSLIGQRLVRVQSAYEPCHYTGENQC